MTPSIAIFGLIFLSLMTAVVLEHRSCNDWSWWTGNNVLVGAETPVYFYREVDGKHEHDPVPDVLAEVDDYWHMPNPVEGLNDSEIDSYENECSSFVRASKTIYPRIVVIVDYGMFERHEKSVHKLLEYLVGVWNGVDLNFKDLNSPKVRLNIAGIIIEERPDLLPFLPKNENGRLLKNDAIKLFGEHTSTGKFPWVDFFGRHHVAVLMTSAELDFGSSIAQKSEMCFNVDVGPPSSIILPDDGGWSIITRELTYQLGWCLIELDLRGCPDSDSVINDNNDYNPDLPLWSECHLEVFERSFQASEADCFYERPEVTSPLDRILPGSVLACHGLCGVDDESECCEQDEEDICRNQLCITEELDSSGNVENMCTLHQIFAPAGTSCAEGKYCYRRKCVFPEEMMTYWDREAI